MAAFPKSEYLPGETFLFESPNVTYSNYAATPEHITFHVTNFRFFVYDPEGGKDRRVESFYLGSVTKMEVRQEPNNKTEFRLIAYFRDVRKAAFVFPGGKLKEVNSKLLRVISPKSSSDLFAFKHHSAIASKKADKAWELFDLQREFQTRMEVPCPESWVRKTDINSNYDLCRVYPKAFYVPSPIKDVDLWRVSIYRGEGRIPILAWRGKGCVICRASRPNPLLLQDMVGMTPVRNESDQRVVDSLHKATYSSAEPKICIVNILDREEKSTVLMGDCHDDTYVNCTLFNVEITSTLDITQHYVELAKCCTEYALDQRNQMKRDISRSSWLLAVEELISLSLDLAERICLEGVSLLIQSRDGDDVCAQASSLVQLMVDGYYRTIKGFGVLIEKEWAYMGHKFCDFTKNSKAEEVHIHAATWILFLDAIWQLTRAYPSFFEFNEEFLLFLALNTFSNRFGNFLFACEKARKSGKWTNTQSIWGFVQKEENLKKFRNEGYSPDGGVAKVENCEFPLERGIGIGFWAPFFLRYVVENPFTQFYTTSKNALAKFANDTRVEEYDLSGAGIMRVPENLPSFGNLTALSMKENFLTRIPVSILRGCKNLNTLELSHNHISSISYEEMAVFKNCPLATLDLSFNGLRFLSTTLEPLQGINSLFLNNNKIDFVPDLSVLSSSLRTLNLANNKITTLTGFGALEGLQEVYLLNNELRDIGDISALKKLVLLDITNNDFTAVPAGVRECRALQHLEVSDNQLVEKNDLFLNENLKSLRMNNVDLRSFPNALLPSLASTLTVISLQSNKLTTFPMGLLSCEKLVVLFLNNNLLKSIPFEICRLVSLQRLAISNNKLSALTSGVTKLPKLEWLQMQNNQIEELPISMSSLTSLSKWEYSGNPIRNVPEEVLSRGKKELIDYLQSLASGSNCLYRMKFMIVGQENVGKTSLLNCLLQTGDKSAKNKKATKTISTDGIDIHTYTFSCPVGERGKPDPNGKQTRTISLTAWDFGGQEVYYTTHQFFLSHRSVFVVVWNLTLDEQFSRVEYWLQSILARARGCRIILVGTHLDEVSSEKASTVVAQMTAKYVNKIPGLVSPILTVSCATGEGIDKFICLLQNVTLNEKTMGENLPNVYLRLETQVKAEAIAKKNQKLAPVMPFSDFKSLAQTCDIKDDKQLTLAIELLHNLGSLIYFQNDEFLSEFVVLNPSWLTNLMSTIMTTKHQFIKGGKIAHSAFRQIWREPDFPDSLHPVMYKILEKFEILHTLKNQKAIEKKKMDEDRILDGTEKFEMIDQDKVDEEFYNGHSLVPSLLPNIPPKDVQQIWSSFRCPSGGGRYGRFYRFSFLPHGLFPRLSNRLFSFGGEVLAWQKGVMMKSDVGVILVVLREKRDISSIEICAKGKVQRQFQLIVEILDSLMDGWYELEPEVKIPCFPSIEEDENHELEKKKDKGNDGEIGEEANDGEIIIAEQQKGGGGGGAEQGEITMGLEPLHIYSLEECEYAVIRGETDIDCPSKEEKKFSLESLVPDILMVSVSDKAIAENQLHIENKIGEGGFADVFRGYFGDIHVAIKKLKFKEDQEEEAGGVTPLEAFSEFRREVWIMSGLAHPALCGLVGFCLYPPMIICEFASYGDLYTFLHQEKDAENEKYREMTFNLRMRMALDMAMGMRYLHTRDPPIIHRDLKSPNVLMSGREITDPVTCKIADFGLSQVLLAPTAGRKVANPVWLAPEVMKKQPYGEKSDVYSFGVMLWELLARADFFGEVSFMSKIEEMVIEGSRPEIPECETEYAHLIKACWAPKTGSRPDFHTIVHVLRKMIKDRPKECIKIDKFTQEDDVDLELRAKNNKHPGLILGLGGDRGKGRVGEGERIVQRNRLMHSFREGGGKKKKESAGDDEYMNLFNNGDALQKKDVSQICVTMEELAAAANSSSVIIPTLSRSVSVGGSSSAFSSSGGASSSSSSSPGIPAPKASSFSTSSGSLHGYSSSPSKKDRKSTLSHDEGWKKNHTEKNKSKRKRILGSMRGGSKIFFSSNENLLPPPSPTSSPSPTPTSPSPLISPSPLPSASPLNTSAGGFNYLFSYDSLFGDSGGGNMDEYTSIALQEDLLGPSSHLTPQTSIDSNQLFGPSLQIRAILIISERPAPQLTQSQSMEITESDDVLWLGGENGKILRMRSENPRGWEALTGVGQNEILTMISGLNGVWSSDSAGVIKYWLLNGRLKKSINTEKTKCVYPFSCLALINNSTLWAGGGDTIVQFDARGNYNKKKRIVLENKAVILDIFYHNGRVWLGTTAGIARANADDMGITSFFPEKVGVPHMIDVGPDVWSCCSDGFIRIWDGETGKCSKFIGSGSSSTQPSRLITIGNCVWCLLTNGQIQLWDPVGETTNLGTFGEEQKCNSQEGYNFGGLAGGTREGYVWATRGEKVVRWEAEGVVRSFQ